MRIAHAYFLSSYVKDERFTNTAIDALIKKVRSQVGLFSKLLSEDTY